MRGKILLTSIIIAAFLGSFVAQWYLTKRGNGDIEMVRSSERIVSLSPSVTETLFELGLGDRVVGVTSFCKYPEEALNLPKVGAYLDPNYEAIVALTPDLVILRKEFEEAKMQLEDLGIRSLTVDQITSREYLTRSQRSANSAGPSPERERWSRTSETV